MRKNFTWRSGNFSPFCFLFLENKNLLFDNLNFPKISMPNKLIVTKLKKLKVVN